MNQQVEQTVIKWMNTSQALINYAAITLAALAGVILEAYAHHMVGNGLIMGIPLSIISVAAITAAVLTGKWWVWAFYIGQLSIGLTQFSALPPALLSLSSIVGAVAAANMMSFNIVASRQQDDDEHQRSMERLKAEQAHQVKMEKVRSKNQDKSDSQNDEPLSDSELWAMNKNGESLRGIAKKTGIPFSTVRRRVNQFESQNESVIHLNGTHPEGV